jgi:ribosome-associated protein
MQENDAIEGRGRSARKREAKAVEQLAQRLADLPDAELARLPQDPELAREIALVRRTSGHSSRKRQIKHLAGLLRRDDERREKIALLLDDRAISQRRETLAFHHLEELRDRLCSAATFESALAEVRAAYPQIDDGRLARLAGSVHEHGDRRAAREIFRNLRQAAEKGPLKSEPRL